MKAAAPAPWPTAVDGYLRTRYGPPAAIVPLGGMSGARVFRVRFATGSVIAKATAGTAEAGFYERVAGALRRRGIPVPDMERSFAVGDDVWLILEDVPRPLSRERWGPDPEVLAVLARLHATTWGRPLGLPGAFAPGWTEETTAAALSPFPTEVAAELADPLRGMRHESQGLFRPLCSISGDPNPTNWGARRDGTLVLYDWERFAAGTPALDLAIALPGLGDGAAYREAARGYRRAWVAIGDAPPWSSDRLAREIALAKVWSVVEFLATHAGGGGAATRPVVDHLLRTAPPWIGLLAQSARPATPTGRRALREEGRW
jgi:hypothetical protein